MTGTSEEQHVNTAKVYAFTHIFNLVHSDLLLALYYIENEPRLVAVSCTVALTLTQRAKPISTS
jgi:hypothetical protein